MYRLKISSLLQSPGLSALLAPQIACCWQGIGRRYLSETKSPTKVGLGSLGSRIAVVGGGPAGVYLTKYLLKLNPDTRVDIFERLPFPFGLVRYGVAPDHPEIKNVEREFQRVIGEERVRLFGGVEIGASLSLADLRSVYASVVVASGCGNPRPLSIPGEYLKGVLPARDIVYWYNSHPSLSLPRRREIEEQLETARNINDECAVIGQGNVAMDIARILSVNPESLQHTDIDSSALSTLRRLRFRKVHIIGRRGWVQTAFKNNEMRELLTLPNVRTVMNPEDFGESLTSASNEELQSSRQKQRLESLLRICLTNWHEMLNHDMRCEDLIMSRVLLRFLMSPVRFDALNSDSERLGSVRFTKNVLKGAARRQYVKRDSSILSENKKINDKDYDLSVDTSLAIVSVGMVPQIIDGIPESLFSDRGVKNRHGKILESDLENGMSSLYVTGWLRRGAQGVIADNIADAQEVASEVNKEIIAVMKKDCVIEDLLHRRNISFFSKEDIKNLFFVEKERGRLMNKVADKIKSVEEVKEILEETR